MKKIPCSNDTYKDIDFPLEDLPNDYKGFVCSLDTVGISESILGKKVCFQFKVLNKKGSEAHWWGTGYGRCQSVKYGVVEVICIKNATHIPDNSFVLVQYIAQMPELNNGDLFHFDLMSLSFGIAYKNNQLYYLDKQETIDDIPDELIVDEASTSSLEQDIAELNKLIGLEGVKKDVITMTNFIKVQQLRKEKGIKTSPISYHCVFTGNPGTGKTTVARIVGRIYHDLGILKKGHLIETDRSGLVAEYIGQTAIKTNKLIDSAVDGVLFIDEAYTLATGDKKDFGNEAIATLLKRMEDERDRLVVIIAGYSDEMKNFINANPGLNSRFGRKIEFEDYNKDELVQIFDMLVRENEYTLENKAKNAIGNVIKNELSKKDRNFGNGRYVRNMFERIIENQANRLSQISNPSEKDLLLIKVEDVEVK